MRFPVTQNELLPLLSISYLYIPDKFTPFEEYISKISVARTIIYLQQHHTYSPNYALFSGSNHFELQRGMRNYHVNSNGWADIGQHFTIFPDGAILTGRSLERSPACITGQNQNAVCIENLGNFDKGQDQMTPAQTEAIIRATSAICLKFNIPVNTDRIVYHHWFRLDNGYRNNGAAHNKSCPGTNFFGGNKVADSENNFIPLVASVSKGKKDEKKHEVEKYVCITASTLNIRSACDRSSPKVSDRPSLQLGAVLRVYEERNGWYKISVSKNHWIYGAYTIDVKRATVNCDILNVRNLPGIEGLKIASMARETEVFVHEEKNDWCRIGESQKWVNKKYLTFSKM